MTVQNLDTTPKFYYRNLQMTVQNQDTIIETAPIEVWAGASYEKGGSRKRIFDSSLWIQCCWSHLIILSFLLKICWSC